MHVLGRLGSNCKSVYVLINVPQDPAFLLRTYTLGRPLKPMLTGPRTIGRTRGRSICYEQVRYIEDITRAR